MTMRTFLSVVMMGGLGLVWPATVVGQTSPAGAPATPTSELRTQLGVSYNNLGLQQSLEWTRRRPIRPGSGPLTADRHVAFGAQVAVSPSYARLHVWAQFAPVSILTLRFGVEPAQYFGTFDSLMPFDTADQPFDTDSRKDRGGARADRATRVYFTPTFRVRVRHVLALASIDGESWSSSSPGTFFYEPTRDTLLKSRGASLGVGRVALMYEHVAAGGTRVGVGGIYTSQNHAGSAEVIKRLHIERAGVITSIQSDGRLLGLRRPNITATVSRYLKHPTKTDEWTATLTVAATLRRR
jgi:hypothetical protein